MNVLHKEVQYQYQVYISTQEIGMEPSPNKYLLDTGWTYSSIVRAKRLDGLDVFFLLPRRCGGPSEGKDERANALHASAGRPEPVVFYQTNYQLSFPFHFSHPPHHVESSASLPVIRLKLPAPCVAARSSSPSPPLSSSSPQPNTVLLIYLEIQ